MEKCRRTGSVGEDNRIGVTKSQLKHILSTSAHSVLRTVHRTCDVFQNTHVFLILLVIANGHPDITLSYLTVKGVQIKEAGMGKYPIY